MMKYNFILVVLLLSYLQAATAWVITTEKIVKYIAADSGPLTTIGVTVYSGQPEPRRAYFLLDWGTMDISTRPFSFRRVCGGGFCFSIRDVAQMSGISIEMDGRSCNNVQCYRTEASDICDIAGRYCEVRFSSRCQCEQA
ncbi:hypothetical protein BKA69DRAFT_1037382 [Paraphysoderma sedebokerense]|nr:hypothetical protein BKA69DRAFT_1037382 [Paraphysoderma sedebokerense]